METKLLKIGIHCHLLLLTLLLLSIGHVVHARTRGDPYCGHRCSNDTYTNGSEFEDNMVGVFSTLREEAPSVLFSNTSMGQGSERVYGLAQCRGDTDKNECRSCVSTAIVQVLQKCPHAKDAIIWLDECQLRYSNTNFFGLVNLNDSYSWNWDNSAARLVMPSGPINESLGNLLRSLTSSIAKTSKPSSLMFATYSLMYTNRQTMYGLAQCTSDTSLADCNLCLKNATSQINSTCKSLTDCEILTGSCRVRYDTNSFYKTTNTTSPSPLPSSAPPNSSPPPIGTACWRYVKQLSLSLSVAIALKYILYAEEKKNGSRKLIILIISVFIVVLITCTICGFYLSKRGFCCFRTNKLKLADWQRNEEKDDLQQKAFKRVDQMDGPMFDLAIIRSATNDFAPQNKLGEGGFGAVYRGQLPDGQEIAVKRLSSNAGNGPRQFDNEVQTLAKLQHRNLVRLLGGFLEDGEKILIYEFVRNASLDYFLFGDPRKRMQLDWTVRSKLIKGIARGLSYLHEDSRLRIIHRDLKASNILLDEDMNPKISDFGTAKIFDTHQTQAETFEIMGTRGYIAPEYFLEGKVSVKLDVFSFGVLLLEIISGESNFSFNQHETDESLLNYAWRLWTENKALQVVDQTLEGTCDKNEILRCIHIGLLCVQEDASSRPKMSKVVAMLENNSLILPSILLPTPSIWKTRNISLGPQMSSTIYRTGSEFHSST